MIDSKLKKKYFRDRDHRISQSVQADVFSDKNGPRCSIVDVDGNLTYCTIKNSIPSNFVDSVSKRKQMDVYILNASYHISNSVTKKFQMVVPSYVADYSVDGKTGFYFSNGMLDYSLSFCGDIIPENVSCPACNYESVPFSLLVCEMIKDTVGFVFSTFRCGCKIKCFMQKFQSNILME